MSDAHLDILLELNKAVKTLNFYPKGHPNLESITEDCFALIKDALNETPEFQWRIDKKGIYHEDIPIGGNNQAIIKLAKQLFLKKVRVLTFNPEITIDDLRTFLHILFIAPEDVFAEGGVAKILTNDKVRGILLNEMSYDEMEEVEEEDAEEEEEEPEEEEETEEEEPEEEEDELSVMLRSIDDEKDTLFYKDLAIRITELVEARQIDGDFDSTFRALAVLLRHTAANFKADNELKVKAGETLVRLLTKDTILYIIDRLTNRDESEVTIIHHLLVGSGGDAAGLLLDALVDTDDANKRRAIFNEALSFGDKLRPMIENKLAKDERWFVKRQMITLLGALGGAPSLEIIAREYGNEDLRVKKEVMKVLATVPSSRASEVLMDALGSEDHGIKGQAIISLGILKDTSAVKSLGEIVTMKDRFSENIEIRKEAIKALGIIKSDEGVEYLTKILRQKKGWFAKGTSDELRILAVTVLGKIGGTDAIKAIEAAYKGSKGHLHSTCKRILDPLKAETEAEKSDDNNNGGNDTIGQEQ